MLPRIVLTVLALAAGLLVGWLAGLPTQTPVVGMVFGAALSVFVVALLDTLRGVRLMNWLRGSQEAQAPREAGFWGEMAYRVERLLRQRERTAEQERKRLAQFLSAIEASPNGVMMLDANDQIEWCNSQGADHFGLDPEGDRLQRITNLVRAPAFVAYLQAGNFDDALLLTSPRGHATLSLLVRPYGDGMKLLLSQDITQRERAEAMRRDFVANVSHEIRTPLTVLAGFVETMATVPLTTVEQPRVLALMRQQTERMQSLVGDLLTLAQLEGSPWPGADRWVGMDALLERLEIDAKVLSGGRHPLTLNVESGCEVAGSDSELTSAMLNLVSNAIRYTPAGGNIDVSWRLRPDRGAEFVVRDTGIGIAREHLPRLTERFYRVDASRARDSGGTGLGLAIVKHVAQRHGGGLEIQSDPGKGSTFRLVLPALRVRTSRKPALAISAASSEPAAP